ncbi:MAG: DM13 domain-containing protein [Thermomicrobiales bacterium]
MDIFGGIERFVSDLYPYRWLIAALTVVALALLATAAYRRGWHLALMRHKLRTALVVVPLLVVTLPLAYYLLSPLWTRTTIIEESPLAAVNNSVPGVTAATRTATSPTPVATNEPPTATASNPAATSEPLPATEPAPTQAPAEELEPTQEPIIETTPEPTPAPALEPTPEPALEPAPEPTEAVFTPRLVSSGPLSGADDFHFADGTALLIETAPGVYVLRLEEFSIRNGPDLFVYLTTSPDQFNDSAINLGDLRATDGSINYDIPPGTDIARYQGVVIWCRAFAVLFGSAPLFAS